MSRTSELERIRTHYPKYAEQRPELWGKFMAHFEGVYEDGTLDGKTKHLIALCGAIVSGCKGCILGQTDLALQKGATVPEIMEVCSVSMSLGGTMAVSHTSMILELLTEKGLID